MNCSGNVACPQFSNVCNADNSLNQLMNLYENGNVLSLHDYLYDAYGNRTTHTENISGITQNYGYSYDPLNRLINVTDGASLNESHAYDPLNNLKSRTVSNVTTNYNHDNANQLTEILQGAIRIKGFVYAAAGKLTQKCESNGTVPVTLTGSPATACSGSSLPAAPNHSFTYDDQGRRLSKTVGTGVNEIATHYLFNQLAGRTRFAGQPGYRQISGAGITFQNDDPNLPNVNYAVDARLATAVEQAVVQTGYTININSMVREPGMSPHSLGRAIDINVINGIRVDDPASHPLVTSLANVLLSQPGVNQVISPTVSISVVGGQQIPITNPYLLRTHRDHIHAGVSPP